MTQHDQGRRQQRRDATGQLIERAGAKGTTWSVRFRLDDGRRVATAVGRSWEGCDRREAERRADLVLAQARLGQWRTPDDRARERSAHEALRASVPIFGAFAAEWLEQRILIGGRAGTGLSSSGAADLRWRVAHLTGWFGGLSLDEIDPREVEAFALAKRSARVGAGGLSPVSTNKTLSALEAIMRRAVRLGAVDRNPVDGYRVPGGATRARTFIDAAEPLAALLDGAGDLDRSRSARGAPWRRAFLATLALGGPRIGEALALTWGDLNLGRARLRVRGTKTEAADRFVPLLPALADELAVYAARRPDRRPEDLIFGTASGRSIGATNVRRRLLAPAGVFANARLAADGREPLPQLTPHSLRRTAASVWFAVGWDLPTVMGALGHRTERMTLAVYAKAMRGDIEERACLNALVAGEPLDPLAGTVTRHASAA